MRPRFAFLALATASLLLLAGCSEDSDTERALRKSVAAQTGTDVQFVECPTAENVKTGQTFRCKALVAVEVTQTDSNGDLRWQITSLSGPPGVTTLTGPTGTTGVTGTTGTTGVTGGAGVAAPASPLGTTGAAGSGGKSGVGGFVTFRNRLEGYTIRMPASWKRKGTGAIVSFTGLGGGYAGVSSAKSEQLQPADLEKELRADKEVVKRGKASLVRIGGATAITLTYTKSSSTGRLVIRRSAFFRGGKRVTLDIGAPEASAKSPAFVSRVNRIRDSFRWR
jgi:hypothetical protein